jgi:DNA mismatch repair protein MutL
MGEIRCLPIDLANQIAAGEVVERPASVVKELVENALDAGATRVQVDIGRGGADLVRVSDDGGGMDADDAVLALERHATSKIRHKDDLFTLHTFGFRGEALPSIASIARLRMVTRARGSVEGTEVVVDGGGRAQARPAGASEGTTVDVRDLFFNVPARRKFMKSVGTEAAHVSEALLLAALSRPDVSFFLVRDGRTAREWLRVKTRQERAQQAFDGEHLEACIGERGSLRIEAHLASPERARAGAVGLRVFVNGRPVRDRPLARAVAQAYGSVLEPGRYPVGVVYVDLPSDVVDVNVHPQKAEVRFADARAVHDATTRELHAALGRAFSLPALGRSGAWSPIRPVPAAPDLLVSSSAPNGFERLGSSSAANGLDRLRSSSAANGLDRLRSSSAPNGLDRLRSSSAPNGFEETTVETANHWGVAAEIDPPAAIAEPGENGTPRGELWPTTLLEAPGFYASLQYLAQVRAMFLVCSGADGLYVLDQHAAAERVTFHRLQRAFESRSIAMQRLLVAEVIELVAAEVAVLEEHAADVGELGVELRAVGPTAVAVHAVPALLARARPERIVRDLVAQLGRAAKRPFADAVDLVLATMACHGSVRAGDSMAHEEATALLRALDAVDFAGHCPHGRPIITRIGYDELQRRVGR